LGRTGPDGELGPVQTHEQLHRQGYPNTLPFRNKFSSFSGSPPLSASASAPGPPSSSGFRFPHQLRASRLPPPRAALRLNVAFQLFARPAALAPTSRFAAPARPQTPAPARAAPPTNFALRPPAPGFSASALSLALRPNAVDDRPSRLRAGPPPNPGFPPQTAVSPQPASPVGEDGNQGSALNTSFASLQAPSTFPAFAPVPLHRPIASRHRLSVISRPALLVPRQPPAPPAPPLLSPPAAAGAPIAYRRGMSSPPTRRAHWLRCTFKN
jgi:hypothetical protein